MSELRSLHVSELRFWKVRGRMNWYEAIKQADSNVESHLLTVIKGEAAGEKALLQAGQMIWASDENGFLHAHAGELPDAAADNAVFDLAGQAVYSERVGSEKKLVICGGGHVSMPVITIAKMVGFHVTVIEDREQFANNAKAQGADEVILDDFEPALARIEGDRDTYFVIVTRGHKHDKNCLSIIVRKPNAYAGMIGSRRHVEIVMQALREEGIPQEVLDEVCSPIGLDIASETPAEIAVSILGEIIEVKNRKRRNSSLSKEMMKALCEEGRAPAVLATIVAREGSAPRGVGTKMLVREDGTLVETIGGGGLEARVIREAGSMLQEGMPFQLLHADLAESDSAEKEGMVCGGVIDVMMETV